jgi:predicted nucleic acid-binding protein
MEIHYLETSVFSFYYDSRTEPEIVARRNWTRRFWDHCTGRHSMMTGAAVLTELSRGAKPHKKEALDLALSLPALDLNEEIKEIVAVYVHHLVMPRDPLGDALHLALASYYKCDYLVTWNCRHLANANKASHIKRINARLDLHTPALVTPLEMLGEK